MGIFNTENATERLRSGFWDAYRQEIMSYDEIAKCVPENFTLDEECKYAKCDHCGDQFEVDMGLSPLVNHLQNNHAGYIIEETE